MHIDKFTGKGTSYVVRPSVRPISGLGIDNTIKVNLIPRNSHIKTGSPPGLWGTSI